MTWAVVDDWGMLLSELGITVVEVDDINDPSGCITVIGGLGVELESRG